MQLLLSHELQFSGGSRLSPDELRDRMEERFTRAVTQGEAVTALACEPIGLERLERGNAGITPRVLEALVLALDSVFHASDALVYRDGACLVAVLVGPDPKRIEDACREWVGRANELRVDGLAAPLHASLRIGYGVTQPGKRLFVDTLIRVARAGLDVARCRGAGACVHTMVYDLVQDSLERERGAPGIVVSASAALPPAKRGSEPASPGVPVAHAAAAAPVQERVEGVERRARELTESLDEERRENELLRERLEALEALDGAVAARDKVRIDLLERRLAKVTRALEETEERLAQAFRANAADRGLPSIYRTVQGLRDDEPDRALKAALIKGIFEANLELRARLRTLGPLGSSSA